MEPSRFNLIYDAPVWMTMPERVVLYGTVFGQRPRRTLEIGTFRGGSSVIITAALDDIGVGELVCVDPSPQIAPETWRQIEHRTTLLAGPSPGVLAEAAPTPAQRFQLALIDGDHSHDGVVADIEGVLPVLDDEASLLFHDAHYSEVAAALQESLDKHRDSLVDCGMVSTLVSPDAEDANVSWGGLRMLRFVRAQPTPSNR